MKTREIADSYRTQSASLFNALIEARKSANEAISKTYEGVSLNGAYRDIADTIYTFTGAGVVHPTVLAMLYETRGLIQKAWEANGLKGIIALVDSNILQERNGRDSFWNIFAESAIRGKEAKRVYPKNLKTASRLELLRFVSSDQWTANPGKERKSAVVVLNSSSNEARAETYCLMHDKLILDMMPGLIAKLGDKSDGAANPSQILDASFKELTLPLCKEWINGLKGYVMTSGYEYQLTDMLELPEIYDIQNSTLPFYNSYEMYSKVLSIWRREFIKEVEKTKNAKQDAKGKGPGGTSIDRAVSSAINSELVNQNVNPAVSFKAAGYCPS
ncbi:MAG: hypothetical protein M1504_00220, partial [Candidatus Marsarchaeota archaeon]|nr:hypothetical protein [Candidatus Marsarchaeota archaeon]